MNVDTDAATIATLLIDTSHGCHTQIEREDVAGQLNYAATEQNADADVVASVGLMPLAIGERRESVGIDGESVVATFVDYPDGSALVLTFCEEGYGETLAVVDRFGATPTVVAY